MSGLRVFLSWCSMLGESNVSEQKVRALSPCRSSFETNLFLWWVFDVVGWFLVSEWGEGSVRDRGSSISWDGGFLECMSNFLKRREKCEIIVHFKITIKQKTFVAPPRQKNKQTNKQTNNNSWIVWGGELMYYNF